MLTSISWQEFLTGLAVLASGYYVIAIVLLYGQEFTALFKSKPDPSGQSVPHSQPTGSVMGGAIQEKDEQTKRSTTTASEEIAFTSDDDRPDETYPVRSVMKDDILLVGTVADALEEIKTVIQAIADAEHDKERAALFFQTLLSRYSRLAETPYQHAITFFICEAAKAQLPFRLHPDEVNAWWKSE